MNTKNKKRLQKQYAKQAVLDYFNILKNTSDISLTQYYVKEIISFQTAFNLKFTREEKLSFCKQCYSYHPTQKSLEIRFNSKLSCIEYRCIVCNSIKRFKYK